ncbi:hypothetical protein [Granulicella sp. S190]|uniref:hypothetical protein n=1 Tax=Granulicella sp. S190 TaxID=1747226 RepID=UPI00131ED0E6|nr:hypothetical protein [Granulicella sp. S190]
MNSSAAEIDLKLRDDFRRYLREYGIESTLIDPVLAVLFRTLSSQIHAMSSDTDKLRTALLHELLEGLGFDRPYAHPAQAIVRYACLGEPAYIAAATELTGEPDNGGRMSFTTDYGISISSARVAAVFVYESEQGNGQRGPRRQGSLRLLSGMHLPEETLRAEPTYDAVSVDLGVYPAIYIALENLGPAYLSGHGIFLQTSFEATLLNAQLERDNWCLASNEGRFGACGVLRPSASHGGQQSLRWLQEAADLITEKDSEVERPRLAGGFWRGKCFVLPSVPADRRFLCESPVGLEKPLRSIFERPALFIRPRAWLRIQLDARVEPLHAALTAVHLHAQSASNVGCLNQTVRFAEHGTTIPVSVETGGHSLLVAPLAITGESGISYLPEFHPSFTPGQGRYRLNQGYLTLLPGKMANGSDETVANVRLWMTAGRAGNQMSATRLHSFAKGAPARNVTVENITTAAGGSNGESADAAQQRFSEALLSRQRLITRADLELALRSFDRRITGVGVAPTLARGPRGQLRRLHQITVTALRERFADPEEEKRILIVDLESYLADRVPLDVDVRVEVAWS